MTCRREAYPALRDGFGGHQFLGQGQKCQPVGGEENLPGNFTESIRKADSFVLVVFKKSLSRLLDRPYHLVHPYFLPTSSGKANRGSGAKGGSNCESKVFGSPKRIT